MSDLMTALDEIPTDELEHYLAIAQHNMTQLNAYIKKMANELRRRRDG